MQACGKYKRKRVNSTLELHKRVGNAKEKVKPRFFKCLVNREVHDAHRQNI